MKIYDYTTITSSSLNGIANQLNDMNRLEISKGRNPWEPILIEKSQRGYTIVLLKREVGLPPDADDPGDNDGKTEEL